MLDKLRQNAMLFGFEFIAVSLILQKSHNLYTKIILLRSCSRALLALSMASPPLPQWWPASPPAPTPSLSGCSLTVPEKTRDSSLSSQSCDLNLDIQYLVSLKLINQKNKKVYVNILYTCLVPVWGQTFEETDCYTFMLVVNFVSEMKVTIWYWIGIEYFDRKEKENCWQSISVVTHSLSAFLKKPFSSF